MKKTRLLICSARHPRTPVLISNLNLTLVTPLSRTRAGPTTVPRNATRKPKRKPRAPPQPVVHATCHGTIDDAPAAVARLQLQ